MEAQQAGETSAAGLKGQTWLGSFLVGAQLIIVGAQPILVGGHLVISANSSRILEAGEPLCHPRQRQPTRSVQGFTVIMPLTTNAWCHGP